VRRKYSEHLGDRSIPTMRRQTPCAHWRREQIDTGDAETMARLHRQHQADLESAARVAAEEPGRALAKHAHHRDRDGAGR
jgi:hypothetical protein